MILLTYEELLILSESESLIVKEAHIPGYGGRLYKNRIAINQALPTQAEIIRRECQNPLSRTKP